MEFFETNIGRNKIIINASKKEFLENPNSVFERYFDNVLSLHYENVIQMERLIDIYKGKQDVLHKKRANGDTKINNKVVVNYANQFVNFKKGYYVGRPIKYVNTKQETTESMTYLNKYIKSKFVNKQSKDMVKYENLFTTGLAYTFTEFKNNNGKPIDTENESPFEYYVLENKNTFAVYSNDIKQSLLFTCCLSTINDERNIDKNVYTCYFDYKVATITKHNGKMVVSEIESYPLENPITEYSLNQYRLGLFEIVISMVNSLNITRSNQLDQLEEFVNAYLLFKNVDWAKLKPQLKDMKDNRAIAVKDTENKQADVKSITFTENNNSTNTMYNDMEQRMYDIVGVPMATSNTGQGVSGEAQVYGGGWENAQTFANVDTQYLIQFEKEDLDKFIYISKEVVNSKTKDLFLNDIDIKYTINKSNNMLVKSQSARYFYDMKMPKELILEYCEISPDAYSQSKQWEDYENSTKENEIDLEVKKTKEISNINQINSADEN